MCCLLSSRGERPHWCWVHERSRANVLYHGSNSEKSKWLMPSANSFDSKHSVERWPLKDVHGHVIPTELVYFRKRSNVHLSTVPMRSVCFEKYCTMINAVTQSYPTDSSITIYEAESGVISDPDKMPHWDVLVSIMLASWIARFQAFALEWSWSLFFSLLPLKRHLRIWILLNRDKWLVVADALKMHRRPTLIMQGARFRDWRRIH